MNVYCYLMFFFSWWTFHLENMWLCWNSPKILAVAYITNVILLQSHLHICVFLQELWIDSLQPGCGRMALTVVRGFAFLYVQGHFQYKCKNLRNWNHLFFQLWNKIDYEKVLCYYIRDYWIVCPKVTLKTRQQ